jgi:hypothetical protein
MTTMRTILFAAAAAASAVGASLAQTTPPPPEVCLRPARPELPRDAAGLALADITLARESRDRFLREADVYRACLDRDIEARMQAMFAANAPLDPVLESRGREHEAISAERADVYESFVRLCIGWENATQRAFPGGCVATTP